MEYLTLTATPIYQEMDHVLELRMLNCFSGTASKQGPFKAVHDLTELALPTLLLLQCLPLPHLTVTKKPQGPCPFSNLKKKSRHHFAVLSVSFQRNTSGTR